MDEGLWVPKLHLCCLGGTTTTHMFKVYGNMLPKWVSFQKKSLEMGPNFHQKNKKNNNNNPQKWVPFSSTSKKKKSLKRVPFYEVKNPIEMDPDFQKFWY